MREGNTFFFINLFILFIYLFIFGCVGSSLLHTGFLQFRRAGASLRCIVRASHCGGFSCCRARALGARAAVVVARGLSSCGSRALECRLSSCGAQAQLLRGMWDLPGPGLEPVSPALAGRFLTTVPPGKSWEGSKFDVYCVLINTKRPKSSQLHHKVQHLSHPLPAPYLSLIPPSSESSNLTNFASKVFPKANPFSPLLSHCPGSALQQHSRTISRDP